MRFFEHLDLTAAGRVFVVGDIHGMFTLLDSELAKVGFDPATDHLLSVGDLVDRGPESHLAVDYAEQPWFHHIRGNHEDLVLDHVRGYGLNHINNGGEWFERLSPEEQRRHARILNDAPIVMEVLTPARRWIGLVHAGFMFADWGEIGRVSDDERDSFIHHCLWTRKGPAEARLNGIRNIDHVFFGHTPMRSVARVGNCSWIDTGACFTGKLTVLELS